MALGKCNRETGKCESCKDGAGCIPKASCDDQCKKGPVENMYNCSWKSSKPQCLQDPKGTMNKTECAQKCEEPAFGKCDTKNNTCVKCNHTSDPSCLYTMDYCKTAQKEGRCKADELKGLFRMIEVNPSYDKGEFDVLFKDGKMYMQDFVTKVEAKDLGAIKATGTAEGGGVTF